MDWSQIGAHETFRVMKKWFEELPQPIVPQTSYSLWIQTSSLPLQQRNSKVQELFQELGLTEQNIVEELLMYFQAIVENFQMTKITSSHLGGVFCQLVFGSNEQTMVLNQGKFALLGKAFIETIGKQVSNITFYLEFYLLSNFVCS